MCERERESQISIRSNKREAVGTYQCRVEETQSKQTSFEIRRLLGGVEPLLRETFPGSHHVGFEVAGRFIGDDVTQLE